jgi:hypothetical protein
MRITDTGNVGIGTTAPASLLHISGTGDELLRLTDTNGVSTKMSLYNGSSVSDSRNWAIATNGYTYGDLVFSSSTTNANDPSEVKFLIKSTGNVGIGTTSPTSKLEVLSATSEGPSTNGILRFSTNTGTDDRGNKIGSVAGAGTLGYSYWQAVRPGVASDGNLSFNPLGGNVGIATTTPSEKLEVAGNAKATTFISTQATGTAPLTVASTTAVTNLNADLLDGNHASAFLLTSAVKEQLKYLYVYGKAQSAITKGQAVQFAGVQGDHILIKAAVPSEINTNPDYFIGLAESTLATNDFGYILTQGELVNVNTSAYTAGNILWFASAGSTAGALTATEPTGTNAKIQVGAVTKVNATEGIILTRMHIFGVEIADIAASGTASISTFLRGDGAWSSVTASNVGLGNVTNESKATMFTSPAFTVTPTAPTATAGTNTTQIATTAFVSTAVANLINSAPGALDTLDELAAALGDDANYAATITTALAGKAATSHTHAIADVTNLQTSLDAKLPLAGGTITLASGTLSNGITFNTAQTFTGPRIRGSVQNLQRAYYTDSYTIWDAGNDGAGSGLDADTVDGIQASSFALAISKYKATGTSSTSGVTTRTAVTTITLLANKYYHLDVTGMYSKTSTSGSTAPVINIAVDNTNGTPTINGRFEWLNGSAATAYTVSNTNGAITTSDSARGFTAATATLSAITTTPWGLKALFYTGTSDKILTFYISSSSAVSGTCAVDMISIRAEEVAA